MRYLEYLEWRRRRRRRRLLRRDERVLDGGGRGGGRGGGHGGGHGGEAEHTAALSEAERAVGAEGALMLLGRRLGAARRLAQRGARARRRPGTIIPPTTSARPRTRMAPS